MPQSSYKPIEDEIEETLDQERKKKFDDIMKDEFALFGEEEKLENEKRGSNLTEEQNVSVNETSTESNKDISNTTIGKGNPFKKFSKEYKKEDYV